MITRERFEAGQRIKFGHQKGIIRFFEKDLAVVMFDGNGDAQTFKPSILREALRDNELAFLSDEQPNELWHPNLNKYQYNVVKLRLAYVRAMDRDNNPHEKAHRLLIIEEVSKEINDPKPPTIATISRWYASWIKGKKNKFCLVPSIGGNRSSRSPEMTALMDKVIRKEYLKLSKPSKGVAYRKLENAYDAYGLASKGIKLISPSTFSRHIDNWDRLELIAKREGDSEARAEARSANHKIKLSRVLERVEADTGHFNIGLISNCGKYYIGKPTIYFIFDAYSRALLGYAIEIRKGGESASGAIHAFKHAMSIKLNTDLYPMYGVIETIVMDNGVGYRAEETQNYLSAAGCQRLDYVPTHSGWHKGMVERFIGSCRSTGFSNMDGYLGKYDPKKFKNDPLKKHAKYTLSQFLETFEDFIINYHNKPQDGLGGFTPLEMWNDSTEDFPPLALDSNDEMNMLIGEVHQGKLSHVTGIKIGLQRFNSDELQEIYHDLVPAHTKEQSIEIEFRVDWSDASSIKVQHPKEPVIFHVPNVDEDSLNKSFAEATCTHKKNLIKTSDHQENMALSSHVPVMTPSAAQTKINNKIKRRGIDLPQVAIGETPDFNLFLTGQNPQESSESDNDSRNTDTQESTNMPFSEEVKTEDSEL
jgi:hypothetical protein